MRKGGIKTEAMARDLAWGRVTLVQKMLFARHLSVMLRSGIAISDALKLLYGSSQGKFKQIIGHVYTELKSGRSLASALAVYPQVFSSFFRGSVLAGEASGSLQLNLENIALQLKKDKELSDKVRSALFYPVIVLSAAVVIGLFIAVYILPKITPLLAGLRTELPWTTRLLIHLSAFAQAWGIYLVLGVIALCLLLAWLIRQTWTEAWFHKLWLSLPIASRLIHHVNLSRLSLNLAILLKSGLTITEALALTADSLSNYYYRAALLAVKKGVNKGGKLSVNMASYPDYFPEIAVKMIKVGEESGHLEEVLFYIAEFYEAEADNVTKNLATAIEPILLVIIGIVVTFLAVAVITPIYSITGSISR